jgi:hypothetical protein
MAIAALRRCSPPCNGTGQRRASTGISRNLSFNLEALDRDTSVHLLASAFAGIQINDIILLNKRHLDAYWLPPKQPYLLISKMLTTMSLVSSPVHTPQI